MICKYRNDGFQSLIISLLPLTLPNISIYILFFFQKQLRCSNRSVVDLFTVVFNRRTS
jgi:hypothetical protein